MHKTRTIHYTKNKAHYRNEEGRKHTPVVCKICGKRIKSVPSFTTHILNKHNLNLDEYCAKYFKNLTPNFKIEKCGFCDREALPVLIYNIGKEHYWLTYDTGFMCGTDECIDNICLEFFGKKHKDCKKQYEHIGAKSEFLARRFKRSIEDVKVNLKHDKHFKYKVSQTTSLKGYIARYGKEEGTRKYNERCKKISNSLKLPWFIERYGLEEGKKKYAKRYENVNKATADIIKSKCQYELFNALASKDSNWKAERYAGGGRVDMLNAKTRLAIEYFGDYWHCNPKRYEPTFYNKSLSMTAEEKQKKDCLRLHSILLYSKHVDRIVVVWEYSYKKKGLQKILALIEKKLASNTKKGIIWI